MELKRVVVTGLGTINSLGKTVPEYWESIKQGTSGASLITGFDVSNFKTKFACEIKDFKATDYIDRKEARKLDKYTQYAIVSSIEAMEDAAIDLNSVNLNRCGVIWGSGIGGIETFTQEIKNYVKGSEIPKFNPFFIPKMIANMASGHISIRYGFRGPNYSTVSACASSTHALIDSFTTIRLGKADIMISGGSEAAINEAGLAGFNAMHAISTRNDDPSTASRPFDVDRDGFVMADGSGTLILEEYEHAKKRGAKIYAEIIGGGMTADAHHITAPHPDGSGAALVMQNAIDEAGIKPEQVDYVNVHGTSTPLGDIAEPIAIKTVFGEHAYKLSISATKSMTGHLLGAAGAVESIATLLSIKNSLITPTINQFNLDPKIDPNLDFTFNKAKEREVNIALCNTFGFGGQNATVVFKKIKN